jgi:hypothetical protein
MAYQTGTATDPNDLLQKLVAFLATNGWTTNKSQTAFAGAGWRAHLSKGVQFINLHSVIGNHWPWTAVSVFATLDATLGAIYLYGSTGYDGAAAWDGQPGAPIGNATAYTIGAAMQLDSAAITAYHFFSDANDNVIAVIERNAGIFTHLGFGVLDVVGAPAGTAQYFFGAILFDAAADKNANTPGSTATACCPFTYGEPTNGATSAFVKLDIDGGAGQWIGIGPGGPYYYGSTGRLGASPVGIVRSGVMGGLVPPPDIAHYANFQLRSTSALSAQAQLLPIAVYAARDAGGYSLVGWVPSLFCTSSPGDGFAIGSTISLGADTYMLFPNFAVKQEV